MSDRLITHAPHQNTSEAQELATLAAVYRFIVDCHVQRKAAEDSGGENDGRGVEDAPARRSIP